MRPVVISKVLAASSANKISLSQSLAGAGNLLINGAAASGGVATLDTARRVLITDGGNNSAITYTITGTNSYGNLFVETVAGTNGSTVATKSDFLTVTKIAASGAVIAGTTVGTNGVGSTPWVSISPHFPTVEATISCEVTGTVNYTVEYTYQDVNYSPTSTFGLGGPDFVVPTVWPDSLVTGLTISAVAVMNDPVWAARATINSGSGTLKTTFLQGGLAGSGR